MVVATPASCCAQSYPGQDCREIWQKLPGRFVGASVASKSLNGIGLRADCSGPDFRLRQRRESVETTIGGGRSDAMNFLGVSFSVAIAGNLLSECHDAAPPAP